MRLNLMLEDESGELETVMFAPLAEKLIGIELTNEIISKGIDKFILPEEAKKVLNKNCTFIVGITDQAYTKSVLDYKIFHFAMNPPQTPANPSDKGKSIVGCSTPS